MSTMTPRLYEEKRNELMSILGGILNECTGLDAKTKKELEETQGKLKRNSFEIVLVGEFQGGKSTTFNTICDGRVISPIGIGIKTSACKVSAVSLPENEEEYVDIRWKSDEELLKTMYDFIRNRIADQPDKLRLFEDEDGQLIASLNTPEIAKIAKKCIDEEWELYGKNRTIYDPDNTGKLDLLQISTVILQFFNDKKRINNRANVRIKITELQNLVAFPRDWAVRWAGGKDAVFNIDEINFVFLANAVCHIHCKNLERLGCTITDCPGLFAGRWDTEVAIQAMQEADAILYLIGGARAISVSDLTALKHIQAGKQEHKLFFAINARGDLENIKNNLRPNDAAAIRTLGLELPTDESIHIFHSRLALSAKTHDRGVEWERTVGMDISNFLQLDAFHPDDRQKVEALKRNPMEMCRISGFDSLVGSIETDIVNKKFEAVLAKGGTHKASGALNLYESELLLKERNAQKSVEETKAEAESARKLLKDFQKKVQELVNIHLGDNDLRTALGQHFVDEVFVQNTTLMADGITDKIKSLFSNSPTFLLLVWDVIRKKGSSVIKATKNLFIGESGQSDFEQEQTRAERLVEEYVKDAIKSVVFPACKGWVANLCQGNNITFRSSYGKELIRIQERVQYLWDATYTGGEELLNGLDVYVNEVLEPVPVSNPSSPEIGGVINMHKEIGIVLGQRILNTFVAPIIGAITALTAHFLLFLILGSIVFAGPVVIGALILAVFSSYKVGEFIEKYMMKKLDEKFRAPLQLRLREHFQSHDEQKQLVRTADNGIVRPIVEGLKKAFENSLANQKAAFEKRVAETEELKQQAVEEQEAIASKCKTIREREIAPAAKKVHDFNAALSPYFVKK